jgi:hypothetical protein
LGPPASRELFSDPESHLSAYIRVHLRLNFINENINRLVRLAEAGDAKAIRHELKRIVPEYTPWDGDQNRSSRQESSYSSQPANGLNGLTG